MFGVELLTDLLLIITSAVVAGVMIGFTIVSIKSKSISLLKVYKAISVWMQSRHIVNYSTALAILSIKRVATARAFNSMLYIGVVIALFVGFAVDQLVLPYMPTSLGVLAGIIAFAIAALVAYYIVRVFATPKAHPSTP